VIDRIATGSVCSVSPSPASPICELCIVLWEHRWQHARRLAPHPLLLLEGDTELPTALAHTHPHTAYSDSMAEATIVEVGGMEDVLLPSAPGCVRGPTMWSRKSHANFDNKSKAVVVSVRTSAVPSTLHSQLPLRPQCRVTQRCKSYLAKVYPISHNLASRV
jgi:hypothetical protein